MGIKAISSTLLNYECDACHEVHTTAVNNLQVGTAWSGELIELPPCESAACAGNSRTYLIGEPDDDAADQDLYDTAQHGAINALRALLIAKAKVNHALPPAVRLRLNGERRRAPRRMLTLTDELHKIGRASCRERV